MWDPSTSASVIIIILWYLSFSISKSSSPIPQPNALIRVPTIPKLINYISTFTPLAVGDVIVTGTPGGVGDRRDPPLYLKSGDKIEVEISEVGILKNFVMNESDILN